MPTYGLPAEVLFCDESHLSNQPYVTRTWSPAGKPLRLATAKSRRSCTIIGALSYSTQRCYYQTVTKGNAKSFIKFLKTLMKRIPDRRVILVVDNSSVHKARLVKAFLRKHWRIQLMFLPTYSPEYNPIERFWHWLKRQLSGLFSYAELPHLKKALRSLIMRYNENWQDGTIKFSFGLWQQLNLVQDI